MNPNQIDPAHYDQQLQDKARRLSQLLITHYPGDLDIFPSPKAGYRMRAEFKIWHDDGQASYAMYRQGEYKQPYIIDAYPAGSDTIVALMPKLLERINQSDVLKRKLFQVEFLSTLDGQCVITLIYHKPLDSSWEFAARELMGQINASIIGRSRKQKLVLHQDYVVETLNVAGRDYQYQQVETGFTQPNARVCEQMLEWAVTVSTDLGNDLLELYCGNGNFTLPLSQNFNRVLATEISKLSVNSAHWNLQKNSINNVEIVRMSSEEITSALNGERPFRRLREIDLGSYDFSTVFVDPPRAGLDPATLDLVSRFDNVLYISCNPETLAENLKQLCSSHNIVRAALFDQFPYTHHTEAGVLLRRR